MIVHHLCVDIRQACLRNSIPLLDRKRMLGGFKFDVRSDSIVAKAHLSLEIDRVRIRLEPRIKPPKEWTDVRAFRGVGAFHPLFEACVAQGDPDTPNETLSLAVHRDLNASPDEEPLLVNNALISTEATARLPFRLRNLVVTKRCASPEGGHATMDLAARRAFELELHCLAA